MFVSRHTICVEAGGHIDIRISVGMRVGMIVNNSRCTGSCRYIRAGLMVWLELQLGMKLGICMRVRAGVRVGFGLGIKFGFGAKPGVGIRAGE